MAQPVFKTGEVWEPQAGSVRLRGRSALEGLANLDGFEATRRITAVLPYVRVVIVSGAPQRSHLRFARQSGPVAYFPKDCTIAALAEALLEGVEEKLASPLLYAIAV